MSPCVLTYIGLANACFIGRIHLYDYIYCCTIYLSIHFALYLQRIYYLFHERDWLVYLYPIPWLSVFYNTFIARNTIFPDVLRYNSNVCVFISL